LLPTAPQIIHLPLKLDDERLSLSLEIPDYATFAPDAIENEAHLVLERPLYNLIKDKFPSLFENVIPRSLKSFFQLDHQVDISLYLIEANVPRNSRELAGLKPS
jgi:hypothetical protein